MFNSPEAALKFAFRVRGRSIISSSSGVFVTKDQMRSTASDRITAWDYHAQSGMIFSKINRMPIDSQAWIYFTYGNSSEKSSMASVLTDVAILDRSVKEIAVSKNTIKLILNSPTVRSAARNALLTNYKAWKYRGVIFNSLNPLMLRTLNELSDWLKIK